MKMKNGLLAAAVATALVPGVASATAGLFQIGYGAKNVGVGGTGAALFQDSIAAAVNPAGMSFVGDSADMNLRFFSPIRDAEIDMTGLGGSAVSDQSSRELFGFPTFGYYKAVGSDLTLGVSGYANGGMNSNYDRNVYWEAFSPVAFGAAPVPSSFFQSGGCGDNDLCGVLGIDYGSVTLAPTLAYKLNQDQSIGASLLIGVQRFSGRGLQMFDGLTKTPGDGSEGLTNQGSQWSYGAGVRVGWAGKVAPRVTLGAAYSSKIYMTKFDKYDQLFADGGDLDTPANLQVGAAFEVTPKLTLAMDFQRIFYGDVDALNNPGPTQAELLAGFPGLGGAITSDRRLGASNGMGFGWDDVNVFKVGLIYAYSPQWTFRAGYSHNDSPFSGSDQLLFNVLAPATVQDHATLGFSYKLANNNELNVAYMHAFNNSEDGVSPGGTFGPGGPSTFPVELSMYQNALDISYSWAF